MLSEKRFIGFGETLFLCVYLQTNAEINILIVHLIDDIFCDETILLNQVKQYSRSTF